MDKCIVCGELLGTFIIYRTEEGLELCSHKCARTYLLEDLSRIVNCDTLWCPMTGKDMRL